MHRLKGFYLYNSNRLERLLEKAVEITGSMPCSDPLAKSYIVVQSDGMGRWLSLEIARIKGIHANTVHLTVEKFLQKFASVVTGLNYSEAYDPENLRWTIYGILNDAPRSRYRELNSYIAGDPLKRIVISGKMADLIDQYTVYRPEMVSQWKKGKTVNRGDRDEAWQKELFLETAQKLNGHPDRASLLEDFIKKCDGPVDIPEEMKGGIILFGISTMSRYHQLMLRAVSKLIPVHLFFMNPCREHWGDIVPTKKSEMFKMLDKEELHYESPNRFLSDLGISGREFFISIHEDDVMEDDMFEEPEGTALSMLQSIQKEILNMNEDEEIRLDSSIKVNGCWGMTREMEVLKDELLYIFTHDPDIKPHDVVVITPRIEEYAPYIEAVFGSADGEPVIPYTVADRSARGDGKSVDAFLKIMDLLDTGFLMSDVMPVFEIEPVHRKFGMTRSDLETVMKAVRDSGIKWGIDRRFRELKGAPPFEQNTWRFGFERMLLGYSMPGGGVETFGGVMPYDRIEGQRARTVARFMTFCETLFRTWSSFNMERSLSDWAARLNGLIDDIMVEDSDNAEEMRFLRKMFDSLRNEERLSGIKCAVGVRVIKAVLEEKIMLSGFNRGFMKGGVTFCSIKPLRSIPFKVVCMAGMNDDLFPRDPGSTGFDLIRKYPAPGDRNAKNSDRYFFLESLLSARKYFIVSYSARNARDSSFNICSSPVRLLTEYLARKTGGKSEGAVFRETAHPLQPFSEKYFLDSSPLFTFSAKDHLAHLSFGKSGDPQSGVAKRQELPLFQGPFETALDELISFFMNPPKAFLSKRLGVIAPYIEKDESDSELFSIDNLSAYIFRKEYLEMHLEGFSAADFKRRMRGSGLSPHGPAGKVLLDSVIKDAEPFILKADRYTSGIRPGKFPFSFSFDMPEGRMTISGKLGNIYPDGQVFFKPAKNLNSKDIITWWICHIVMNAAGIKKSTYLCTMDKDIEIPALEEPFKHLSEIAEVYIKGLSSPLPATPFIMQVMADEMNKGESPENAFVKMIEKRNSQWGGEEDDIIFKIIAGMTGFYSGSPEVVKLVADTSRKVYGSYTGYAEKNG
ncbi:MAG TPA: exodeoxyribonuclease V subunit gamma [bacterium]|nr:exodeoxyribonuclease V subunit gamma [bacterium]